MKKLFIALLYFPLSLVAQQSFYHEFHGNDSAETLRAFQAFCLLPSGNMLGSTAMSDTNGVDRFTIMKLDATGNLIWSKKCLSQSHFANHLSADSGSVYFTSTNFSYDYITRTDTSVNPLWSKRIIGGILGFQTIASCVDPVIGGGCYAIGQYNNSTYNDDMLWSMRFDTAGNIVWSKTYSSLGYDLRITDAGMVQNTDKSLVFPFVANHRDSLGNTYRATGLMKLDSLGNSQWVHFFTDSSYSIPLAIVLAPDSGFVIGSANDLGNASGITSASLMRTDKNGNLLWCRHFDQLCNLGYPINKQGLQIMSNGNILYGFTLTVNNQNWDGAEFIECDTSGQVISSFVIGGGVQDSVAVLQLLKSANGDIIAAGGTMRTINNNLTDHLVIFGFDSLNGNICMRKSVSPIGAYDTLRTDYPVLTSSSGPTTSNLGLPIFNNYPMVQQECPLASVDNFSNEFQSNVSIFPNPSSRNITLDVHLPNENSIQFFMYDATGRLLQTNTIQNNTSFILERNNRAEGIYFIKLVGNNCEVYTGKIVFSN